MEGRVPTFCFNVGGHDPQAVAEFLAARDIAVWHGNYYALATMQRLGIESAVRAGFVHYNTAQEVDRLLGALAELA
jgi:selenocysteine lyase/cysteine desulfurase